jgi:tetratricopeptide (TPR) repeat protein
MVQAQAEADTAWGHDLLAQADHVGPPKAEGLAREGRSHLRRAGAAYGRLAASRVATRDYPDDLWKSANAYLEGHDYRNAARTFQQFLKVESRVHQASALAGLGESLLALDRVDEAIAALEKCAVEDPRDASSFRARVLAARARIEKGDLKLAERRLEENLNSDSLTPAGKEWRESLFLLGEVLHRGGRYAEAIARLEEAIARDADSRWALAARYLVADCYHQIAKAEAEKLKQEAVEQSRAARAKRIRELLSSARDQYLNAQDWLLRYQEAHALGPAEKALLRNGCFAAASLLFELGQHDAALKTCTTAVSRYRNSPEALEAYLQIARICRAADRPADARAAVEQAKIVLRRMKPEASFQETTNYSRAQWTELLESW